MDPTQLNSIFQLNPMAFRQAQGMLRQQSEAGALANLLKEEQLKQSRQINPLLVEQQKLSNIGTGLSNDTTRAQLPGLEALSAGRVRQENINRQIPLEMQLKAEVSRIAAQMSKDEWTQTENGIKQLKVSPSADERRIGEMLFNMLPDISKEREKIEERGAYQLQLQEMKNAQRDADNQARVELEKTKAAARAELAVKLREMTNMAAAAKNRESLENSAAAWMRLAAQARLDGKMDEVEKYEAEAGRAMQAAYYVRSASAQTNAGTKLDVSEMLDIPSAGGKPIPQPPVGGAGKPSVLQGQAAEDWITRAMQANKGMTREQVIQEGKRLGKL
jgi:hypothetical protein